MISNDNLINLRYGWLYLPVGEHLELCFSHGSIEAFPFHPPSYDVLWFCRRFSHSHERLIPKFTARLEKSGRDHSLGEVMLEVFH